MRTAATLPWAGLLQLRLLLQQWLLASAMCDDGAALWAGSARPGRACVGPWFVLEGFVWRCGGL